MASRVDKCCAVCRQHLEEAEVKAVKDQAEAMNRFRSWASQRVPGAQYMNVGSGAQIRQLLFAGVQNQKPEKGTLETERVFKVRHMQLSHLPHTSDPNQSLQSTCLPTMLPSSSHSKHKLLL